MSANLINVKQLAEKFGVTERTIRDWVYKKKLKSIKVDAGKLVRFDSEKVEEKIKKGNILD